MDGQWFGDQLGNIHAGIQAGSGVLEHDLPGGLQKLPITAFLPGIPDIHALIEYGSFIRPQEAHDTAQRGRLPGAGLPHQPKDFTPPELKGNIVQGFHGTAARKPVGFGKSPHIQQDVSHGGMAA